VLEHADTVRRQFSPRINQTRKAELGQFMPPAGVARFMASLFSIRSLARREKFEQRAPQSAIVRVRSL
jgi:hypothetical protein